VSLLWHALAYFSAVIDMHLLMYQYVSPLPYEQWIGCHYHSENESVSGMRFVRLSRCFCWTVRLLTVYISANAKNHTRCILKHCMGTDRSKARNRGLKLTNSS